MESSNQLRQIREEKLQKIEALVGDAYPRKAHPTDTVRSFVARFTDRMNEEIEQDTNTYSLMGRIIAFRDQGKTVFLHLSDQGSKVQIYLRKDGLTERDWEILHLCDLGDFIETQGTLMRTKTGELTLRCSSLVFLTKALLPLPEKWHGLQDIEIRYRQRYLDLISDPEVFSIFQKRSEIITSIRSFMKTQGYLEVETPMMHSIPGGATAKPFMTHHNALDIPLYLRIAPELFLKQLIIGGFGKIYEINRNFRNEGLSSKHNPEFTMMESYAAGEDLRDMMILVEGVIRHAASIIHKDLNLPWGSQMVDYGKPFQRISLRNSLTIFGNFDEKQIDNIDYLRSVALKFPIEDRDNKSVGLLQFELFEHTIESKLIQPIFITDYPVEVSPLTKMVDGSLEIVDRFELFIGGMEIANAYSELNDPVEQLKRLQDQSRERDSGNEEAMHIDGAFIEAMEHGMPPTGGQGLGIDRLVMLLTNQNSIRDVILFPLMRPSKNDPS